MPKVWRCQERNLASKPPSSCHAPRQTLKLKRYADLAAKYCCMAAISMKPKPKPNVYPKSKATPLYLRSITLW
ncbi:Uncharacterised protein [Vibrio cholerae]|nr:Uncharacterised protein [Vibrio cholerae]